MTEWLITTKTCQRASRKAVKCSLKVASESKLIMLLIFLKSNFVTPRDSTMFSYQWVPSYRGIHCLKLAISRFWHIPAFATHVGHKTLPVLHAETWKADAHCWWLKELHLMECADVLGAPKPWKCGARDTQNYLGLASLTAHAVATSCEGAGMCIVMIR